MSTPQAVATLEGSAELEIDAVAISRDGGTVAIASGVPDMQLTVWQGGPDWSSPTVACAAARDAHASCASLSICPGDSAEMCTVSEAGDLHLRRVVDGVGGLAIKSWCPLPPELAELSVTSHAWSPSRQLIVGFASGTVVALGRAFLADALVLCARHVAV